MTWFQSLCLTFLMGYALAGLWFWLAILLRMNPQDRFKWWLMVIVPQGIAIIASLRLMGIIKL